MSRRYVILGIVFWIAALGGATTLLRVELSAQSSSIGHLTHEVGRWATSQRSDWNAHSAAEIQVALNDPVFLQSSDGTYQQVGQVVNVDGTINKLPVTVQDMQIRLYREGTQDFTDGFHLEYHTTSMSLTWVAEMMIPPERRTQIATLIADDWKVHQQEVMARLKPVMRESLKRAVNAVEAELPAILANHRNEFQQLGQRYEAEIVQAEIMPLVRDEVLPVIEEEAQPLISEIGRSLWNRVSVWSFTWRYLYDKSPLPQKDAVKTEFQRFIEQEATPELQSRSDDFVSTTERIISRVMQNPRVQEALRRNLKKIAEDPELQRLVLSVLREALLENDRLREELNSYWSSPEVREAVQIASVRLEPTVRTIGDMIFGTRETGITPEFSRILRSQILAKDRRWFVMVPNSPSVDQPDNDALTITKAREPMLFPLQFSGQEQSPLTAVE
jgi:hypothetical protein